MSSKQSTKAVALNLECGTVKANSTAILQANKKLNTTVKNLTISVNKLLQRELKKKHRILTLKADGR